MGVVMKLSNETLGVLKNFGSINQSILFKKGKTLKTVSPHKNILAEATITEEIPVEFGVYDLNNFLSVVSLYKDDPSFEFEDKQVLIVGNQGRSKKTYRFCEATMIVTPPEKKMELPTPEIKFDLSAQDFDWVMKNASVLSTPHIAVESNGKKVNIVCLDLQNDAANTDSLEICDGNNTKYRMIFKTENLDKLMGGDYSVEISSKGIAQFTHKKLPLKYWISTESGSKFESK
jgi:hypothetical protein